MPAAEQARQAGDLHHCRMIWKPEGFRYIENKNNTTIDGSVNKKRAGRTLAVVDGFPTALRALPRPGAVLVGAGYYEPTIYLSEG